MAVLALAACTGTSPQDRPVARIGVIVPLEAGLVEFGRGIRNSVQLAVDEANRANTVPGWRLEVVAVDDSSDPGVGETAAHRLAADRSLVGVVGTYNSGVAARVAPVLDEAGVVMVSPANTDPALTLGADPGRPVRPHANYFRMVTADNVQAPFLAQAAFDDLGARRVAVLSETKPVSKGLADGFRAAFAALGGTVVVDLTVPDGTTNFGGPLTQVVPLRPDLVFFGGEYNVAARLSAQATEAGLAVPVMGGDGMKDDAYIANAGPASDGDLASSVGAPLASLAAAREYVAAYQAAGFAEPPSDYGVYAYDATRVIIAAAARALDGRTTVNAGARASVIAAVARTDLAGASGQVSFDAFGDTRAKVLTFYRVSSGAWSPVKTQSVS
ncbi:MAG: branched-chain amino acid ABC transporter substrate-binding protein [Actinomycetota bacterium]